MRTYVIKHDAPTLGVPLYWNGYDNWVTDIREAKHYTEVGDADAFEEAQKARANLDTHAELEIVKVNNRKAEIGIGHVPRGSVVEIRVGRGFSEPIIRTVLDIRCNGCDSFLISCGPHPKIEGTDECYNISHITRVIKRGSGSSKLSSDIERLRGAAFDKCFQLKHKGRNQYGSYSMREIIMLLVDSIAKDEQLVDYSKLVRMIYDRHVLKPAKEGTWDRHQMGQKISKKKLKRLVRQLLPKCLLKRAQAEREYQAAMESDYERDLDRDMEQDREINPDLTEGLNEEGNTQIFLKGEPVCSQCNQPYTNHGADHPLGSGTFCSDCKHDYYDYNDYYQESNADYEEDRNLTLPSEFLTNFELHQLQAYKDAVEQYAQPGFDVREEDCDGLPGRGSLWFFGERDPEKGLGDFWEIFRKLDESPKEKPAMPRYHGFTCPQCGSHMFGTNEWHLNDERKMVKGKRVGHCHENQHSRNGCVFSWDRDDPVAEAAVMYEQTREEWDSTFKGESRVPLPGGFEELFIEAFKEQGK